MTNVSSSSSRELNTIYDDLRKFTFRLRYAAESANYFRKAEDSKNRRSDGAALVKILTDPNELLHYDFPALNERVQRLDTIDPRLKGIWDQLFLSSLKLRSTAKTQQNFRNLCEQFPIDDELETFKDTDLILFENDFPGELPDNGITRGQLEVARDHYQLLTRLFKFKWNHNPSIDGDKFITQVLRDLRVFMSRSIGRDMVKDFLQLPISEIRIVVSNGFTYSSLNFPYNTVHQIEYGIAPRTYYQEVPNVGLRSLNSPPFVPLSHEFCHLFNRMTNQADHTPNPQLPRHYSGNPEEVRAIDGDCGCPNHRPAKYYENLIRLFFGLPKRRFHLGGSGSQVAQDTKFVNGSVVGAGPDVLESAHHTSDTALNAGVAELVRTNRNDILFPLLQEALTNPSLQRGPFALLKSPSDSPSQSPRISQGQTSGNSSSSSSSPLASQSPRRPPEEILSESPRKRTKPIAPPTQSTPSATNYPGLPPLHTFGPIIPPEVESQVSPSPRTPHYNTLPPPSPSNSPTILNLWTHFNPSLNSPPVSLDPSSLIPSLPPFSLPPTSVQYSFPNPLPPSQNSLSHLPPLPFFSSLSTSTLSPSSHSLATQDPYPPHSGFLPFSPLAPATDDPFSLNLPNGFQDKSQTDCDSVL
ncbi:MAG: hypothetical protein JSS32_07080 [Verrucomicrobia bacterium]|nr:hypothetical protein [Verrucomicrobiota bacterium]